MGGGLDPPLDPRMVPANVALRISGDPVQYCKKILYFCDFSGGGGVLDPPLDPCMAWANVYTNLQKKNILWCASTFVLSIKIDETFFPEFHSGLI